MTTNRAPGVSCCMRAAVCGMQAASGQASKQPQPGAPRTASCHQRSSRQGKKER